jgi:predicted nuclease with TOPRIM domain
MADAPQKPTVQKLLERIVRLEAENAQLAARVSSLEKGAQSDHEFWMKLSDKLGGLDEQVLELMEKVFPGHARTQLQIIEILKSKDRAD